MRVIAMFSGPCAAEALTARASDFSHKFNRLEWIIKTCNQLILWRLAKFICQLGEAAHRHTCLRPRSVPSSAATASTSPSRWSPR